MQKRKVSLLFSVAVGLLAVFTASVSTFAWFQANANVNIQTSSSSANITVSAPDELEVAPPVLYAYKENYTYANSTYDNHGYKSDSVNKVSMLWEKGEANMYFRPYQTTSGTNPGYYILGESVGQKYSRCVAKNIITIMPQPGFDIDYVEISVPAEKTDNTYMSTILSTGSDYSVTWANASASSNAGHTLVTLNPVDGSENISTILTKAVKMFSFTVYYEEGGSDSFDLTKDDYYYPVVHDNTNRDRMAWSTATEPAFISDDFTELNTNDLKNTLLSTSKLAPGYKLTFAAKAVATSNVSNASFYLEKYTSVRMMNRLKLTAKNDSSDAVPIAIDEAINVYGTVNTSGWYLGSAIDKFTFNNSSYSMTPASTTYDSSGGNIQTNVFDSADEPHPYDRDELGSNEGLNSSTVYFFFTIEFSDSNTTYFNEYNKVGADAIVVGMPRDDYEEDTTYSSSEVYYSCSDEEYSVYSSQPGSSEVGAGSCYTAKERYFVRETTGNSNCYQGLTFQINRISLELS